MQLLAEMLNFNMIIQEPEEAIYMWVYSIILKILIFTVILIILMDEIYWLGIIKTSAKIEWRK